MSDVVDLSRELIRRRSVTPADDGCQQLIADRLDALGFVIEDMPFGEVTNLWARRGNVRPVFCFAGHTDVVPSGPLEEWHSDPFEPTLRDGLLYGRGAADMKGSIAAMLVATEAFVSSNPGHDGSIAFLITSDEEGIADDGTKRVMETLTAREEWIDFCLVGEPTSNRSVGDTVRIGRRGSLHGKLTLRGVQGHIAYPDQADNPIHRLAPALTELCTEQWDEGNEHFPRTTLQVSNLRSGTGADNVIPGVLEALFNFRFSTAVTVDQLRQRVHAILDRHKLNYKIDWRVGGHPFLTEHGRLIDAVRAAIRGRTGNDTELSTAGGTSDGRFIAPSGAEVVELGPVNASIHRIDEHVDTAELDTLAALYEDILGKLL
ncbi:MAG: succinyl-diaminopimelate desuccinylase [Gammaproteobacteria bacterium]|nr:succinyl-diaminopimelate desuccinylase [Gammaproteobacteria bacterium]NNF59841.1 succinyl-diaminopimelate desuccinylase [Gammaproteobacteria bacterium]NNM21285.1 succinyl-diaminopimelate desuccinylase [Gammaproteobacteria bacterium]